MAPSRNIIVAGAGIGGLTASLALAQRGFRVVLVEQADRLQEAGAGIQLSPNASRILNGLGLEEPLRRHAVVPPAIEIRGAGGNTLARLPLDWGSRRYGAPYWVTHRADLQSALIEAVRASPDIVLKSGTMAEDFVTHGNGITVACRRGPATADEAGIALICADGLWSKLRLRLGVREKPVFSGRVAWRALIPAGELPEELRDQNVRLWLGRGAHLVHYPVRGGAMINIVAIVNDRWDHPGANWSEPGEPREIVWRFSQTNWSRLARSIVAAPQSWQKWALHDLPPLRQWGEGPVTLLGDAAHPMLPFLAQGAAMAIEDAAVLAGSLARTPDDIAGALRRYERGRRRRTWRAQRAARSNSRTYHLAASEAAMRNFVLRTLSGKMLLRRYDWLYDWRPAPEKA